MEARVSAPVSRAHQRDANLRGRLKRTTCRNYFPGTPLCRVTNDAHARGILWRVGRE